MLGNQKGFSLGEVMTASAIVGIIVTIVASLIIILDSSYKSKLDSLEAQEQAAKAEFLLKMVFSQAVWVGEPVAATPFPASMLEGYGRIRNPINFDRIQNTPAAWTPIAIFHRESQSRIAGVAAVDNGELSRTGIWYRRPEAPTTTGVLFFDLDTRPPAGGVVNMGPTYQDDYVERISSLVIEQTLAPLKNNNQTTYQIPSRGRPIVKLDVRMQFRFHTKRTGAQTWCPAVNINGAAPIGACNVPNAIWHDLDRRFSILLRNNVLRFADDVNQQGTGGIAEERVLGNLYFFQPTLPNVGRL